MAELEGKIAVMEAKLTELSLLNGKMDKMLETTHHMDLLLLSLKQEFVTKIEFKEAKLEQVAELKAVRTDFDEEIKGFRLSQSHLLQAVITSGVALTLWLLQQLLGIQIHLGGGAP